MFVLEYGNAIYCKTYCKSRIIGAKTGDEARRFSPNEGLEQAE